MPSRTARLGAAILGTLFIGVASSSPVLAHSQFFQLAGKKIEIKTTGKKPTFSFQTEKKQDDLILRHDPSVEGFSLLVVGSTGRTEFITLDPTLWKAKGKGTPPKAWKYKDKEGTRGGITNVQLKAGSLKIKGKGDNWNWSPEDAQGDVWVWAQFEDEWYCSQFGGDIKKNEAGHFKARKAPAPGACPVPTCGNNEHEIGEDCDDGNKDDEDGCSIECTLAECDGNEFDTTFDAIQSVVLEGYGCTASVCHGQADPISELSLFDNDSDGSWDSLVGIPAKAKPEWDLVEPSDIATSFLYEKLAAAVIPGVETTGTPMPNGGMLTPEHLEAIEIWIRGAAPRDGIVDGTAELLGTCLPPPTPLKIEPPVPPGAGVGVQLRSSAWSLPAESENEVCMSSYYDFTATNLIPEEDQFDCPGWFGPNNPSDKCFRYHKQLLLQDPQSHHSIIHIYTGDGDTSDLGWGAWTFKMNDGDDDPLNGTDCEPLEVDPATGVNEGCSGEAARNSACISGYGPEDWSTGFGGLGGQGTAPQFSGSQESHYEQEFADGVYAILPMAGIPVWNSHAFNLTSTDTTLAQYLNLELAAPEDRLYPLQGIFEADDIFVQDVPPFETREYCASYTIPRYGNLFWLSSHTHIRGVRWRTWMPPNAPCNVNTCVPGDPAEVDYVSTIYNDPVQMPVDPPIPYDSGSAADRTFLYCSLYDNGSTPDSPPVKRFSTSPPPPESFLPIGGPCNISETACFNEGPAKGQVCGGDASVCDTGPGAGDGVCDACPLKGGFTTEDEMFILLGNYYID